MEISGMRTGGMADDAVAGKLEGRAPDGGAAGY
jgi:hypothetical protein